MTKRKKSPFPPLPISGKYLHAHNISVILVLKKIVKKMLIGSNDGG
jgi:hypothetical protein